MSTRLAAAEKLVRQLLELPLSRLTPLSDAFITSMGKIVTAHFAGRIRPAAAERLVKQLLELRLSRLTPLSDEFIAGMGEIVLEHVEMDELRQRSEQTLLKLRAVVESIGASDG